MGRAFEYRKATKLKRWGHMARTFTKLGKQIAVAVKAGGPAVSISYFSSLFTLKPPFYLVLYSLL